MPFMQFDLEMNRKSYVAHKVLTPRPVAIQAANVGKIKLEQLLSQMDTKRSPGAGYKRSDFVFDSFSYATEEYGDEAVLDDRQVGMFADILDAETIHTQRAINFVLDQYERDAAAIITSTSSQTVAGSTFTFNSANVTAKWNDKVNATPIEDIIAAREQVILNSGLAPNVLVMSSLQFYYLINTNEMTERVKYTETATQEEMASLAAAVLGIPHIHIAGGLKNTAVVPTAATVSRIWPTSTAGGGGTSNIFLCRAAETEDPQEPCVGRTFMWTGDDNPGAVGTGEELAVLVEEYREEKVRGSVLRARNDRQIVIMYPQAGYILSQVIQ